MEIWKYIVIHFTAVCIAMIVGYIIGRLRSRTKEDGYFTYNLNGDKDVYTMRFAEDFDINDVPNMDYIILKVVEESA